MVTALSVVALAAGVVLVVVAAVVAVCLSTLFAGAAKALNAQTMHKKSETFRRVSIFGVFWAKVSRLL